MKSMISKLIISGVTVSCLCAGAAFGVDEETAAAHPQGAGVEANHGRSAQVTSTRANCPRPAALDAFKRQIAYMRSEKPDPLEGLQDLHLDVLESKSTTVFYVQAELRGFTPSARMVYVVVDQGARRGYTCPATEEGEKCAVRAAGGMALANIGWSCSITLDPHTIPVWKLTSNDLDERRISADMRKEIAPPAFPSAKGDTPVQVRQRLVDMQLALARSEAGGSEVKAIPSRSLSLTPANCPNPSALEQFMYQIEYQRAWAWGGDPFKGLSLLHVDVWMRGPLTGLYVRERRKEYAGIREADIFDESGRRGGGSCPPDEGWRRCIERFAGQEYSEKSTNTCTTTLNLRTIPAWKPSPNDDMKRHVAVELRTQVEAQWPSVQQIRVRDFNLRDNALMIWMKFPDREIFQHCAFYAMRTPPCEKWGGFGMDPEPETPEIDFQAPVPAEVNTKQCW